MQKRAVQLTLVMLMAVVLVLGISDAALGGQWSDLPESVMTEYGVTEEQVARISEGFNGAWKPWADITRAQFTKMAMTAFRLGESTPETPSFADVPKDGLYYGYIEGAKAAGLVNGVTSTTFNPDDPITREEAIGIISRRAASVLGSDLATMYIPGDVDSLLGNFSDAASISAGLRPELALAFEYGIAKGSHDSSLKPLSNLWRAQAAALLIRSEALISPPRVTGSLNIAVKLGSMLAHEIGVRYPDSGVGWILNQAGLGMTVADETLQLLKDVSLRIEEISAQISSLQNQLASTNYNVLAASLGAQVSAIQTAHGLLTSLAASPSPAPQSQIDDIYNLINNHIMPGKNQISNAMLGIGFADGGLIKSWSRAVAGSYHFFNTAASDAQYAMYDYWMDIQAIQEELVIEYMHYRDYTIETLAKEFDDYVVSKQAQQALFPRTVNPGFYIVRGTGSVYYDIMLDSNVFKTRSPMEKNIAVSVITDTLNGTGSDWKNWRLPTLADTQSMFDACPSDMNLKFWMIDGGWFNYGFPASTHPLTPYSDFTFWLDSKPEQAFALQMDGREAREYGWANLLPVRYLAYPEEFYFYR